MTEDQTPRERARAAKEEAARRRKIAEVFGDVIPEQTSDDAADSGEGADRRTGEKAQEDWLKSEVPPHHGS